MEPKTKFYIISIPKDSADLAYRIQQVNDAMEVKGYEFSNMMPVPCLSSLILLIFKREDKYVLQNYKEESTDGSNIEEC